MVKTFIVHVSVDAATKTRAETMIRNCIDSVTAAGYIHIERGEVAVVLDSTDEIEE